MPGHSGEHKVCLRGVDYMSHDDRMKHNDDRDDTDRSMLCTGPESTRDIADLGHAQRPSRRVCYIIDCAVGLS